MPGGRPPLTKVEVSEGPAVFATPHLGSEVAVVVCPVLPRRTCSVMNVRADLLSGRRPRSREWRLNPTVVDLIWQRFGKIILNAYGTKSNQPPHGNLSNHFDTKKLNMLCFLAVFNKFPHFHGSHFKKWL